MNSNKKVLRYGPDIYSENRNMLAVYEAQSDELDILDNKQFQAFLNNFVSTCDLEGIRRWEKLFNILADELKESLDFRKARIKQKLVQVPPYTETFLRQILTNLFGENNFILQIDHDKYIISVSIETDMATLFKDTIENIRIMAPANMAIKEIKIEKYMHIYLKRHYTYGEMKQFTYGELSRYAEDING